MARSGMTRREMQRKETRQNIYDVAINLFTRRGFTSVSVDEICAKAGVSKGTFYYYFKSKDQVLLEEFRKIDLLHEDWLEELSKKHRSPSRVLVGLTDLSFAYLDGQGVKLLKIIYHSKIDPAMKKPEPASVEGSLREIVERLLRKGQETGEMRKGLNARDMAALWVRCYKGIVYEWCLQDGGFDLVEAGGGFTKMFVEYMRGGGTGTVRRR